MNKTIFSGLLLSLMMSNSVSHAAHNTENGRYKNEGKYPVYSIPIRKEDSVDQLDEQEPKSFPPAGHTLLHVPVHSTIKLTSTYIVQTRNSMAWPRS